jgi:hypothetical protein
MSLFNQRHLFKYLPYILLGLHIIVLAMLFFPVTKSGEVSVSGRESAFGYTPSETFNDLTTSVKLTLFSINNFLAFLFPLLGLLVLVIPWSRFNIIKYGTIALLAVSSLIMFTMLPNSFEAARTDNFIARGFFLANNFVKSYGTYIAIIADAFIILFSFALFVRGVYIDEKSPR